VTRKNKEDTRKYSNQWYADRKTKAAAFDKIIRHSHKWTIIGLAMALAMSGASLWLAWRAYDASQWILGR
jgi:hypothetical protein